MKIAQILLPGASLFEKKCHRVDGVAFAPEHQLVGRSDRADIVHVYGPLELPATEIRRLRAPYVAAGKPEKNWLRWRNAPEPARVLQYGSIPEAVDLSFFQDHPHQTGRIARNSRRIGSVTRGRDTLQMYHATVSRLSRFRDDIEWEMLRDAPTAEQMMSFDAWVDPAVDPDDISGYTAEALVAGLPVIAARHDANADRLNRGAGGFLVPPRDPNELAHGILNALFKPEARQPRLENARATRDRFRPERRAASLLRIYQDVLR